MKKHHFTVTADEHSDSRRFSYFCRWSKFKKILYSQYLLFRFNLSNEVYYWNLIFFAENNFPELFWILKKSKEFIVGLLELKSLITSHPCICLGMIKSRKPQIFGMTTEREQAYVRWFARKKFIGNGEIVDLGCWLGSISVSLAQGLEKNMKVKNKLSRIHAFDKFIWRKWMKNSALGADAYLHYREGVDFSDEFRKRIRPFLKFIKIYQYDLKKIQWAANKKIEFLFIDASKSWSLEYNIIKNFYPALIPGKSICVEQDFYYYKTYWVHLFSYRFRKYFKPLFQIPNSASAVFIYKEAIPLNILKKKYSLSSFSDKEIDAAFNRSLNLNKNSWQADILAAKSMCLLARGKFKESNDLFLWVKNLQKNYPDGHFKSYIEDYKNKYNRALK